MREIKYRAWHKERKKMYEVAKIDLWGDPDQATCDLASDDEQLFDIYLHEVVLMQYTGMTDLNGKEIYEGDIVEAWSEGVMAIGEVVERVDGLWILYPAWQKETMWGLCPNKEGKSRVEVLGNIYENPELLEGDQ